MAKIDLHMHSCFSDDGEYSPVALVDMASQIGLEALALTDHNTATGVQQAIDRGVELGIEVIAATELDCTHRGLDFHLLGYFIDHKADQIAQISNNIYQQELTASRTRVALIQAIGIPIDLDEALARSRDGTITGELIAEIVLEKSNNHNNPLLTPFLAGGTRSDNPYVNFYWDYCAQGKPAYVPIETITLKQAITLVEAIGGVPVLAHPGNNLRGQPESMLDEIISLGIFGIEAYSSYHSAAQCTHYAAKAVSASIIATGGSDFHGKTKPAVKLGCFGLDDSEMYPNNGLEIVAALKKNKHLSASL